MARPKGLRRLGPRDTLGGEALETLEDPDYDDLGDD